MFCGHFAIGQIYASGLFHAITDVNVIVPLPSLAWRPNETKLSRGERERAWLRI
jgi:hypothetical protein